MLRWAILATATWQALAAPISEAPSATLLFQNNLNVTDDVNHYSALLLSAVPLSNINQACAVYNERPLSSKDVLSHQADLFPQLQYQSYAGYVGSTFWLSDGILLVDVLGFQILPQLSLFPLPVLCSQSATSNGLPGYATQPSNFSVSVSSGNVYTGTRNKKSFWFSGIRYANFSGRFKYSSVLQGDGSNVNALTYGSSCKQPGSGSENCFFLNIETPYLGKQNLRPVLFWIHGGGFTGGSGAGYGGQLASREDVVTVTINYRLGTYGFLAVPGQLNGNFGLADQATALQWVVDNIANFGGDPNQITIAGQSAGAGSVRVLLGSPVSIGKFQGAIAMSNLGFDTSLGLGGGYGTTYSSYLTIAGSYAIAGQNIFTAAGCNQNTVAAQVTCLEAYNGDLTAFSAVARYPVQDGTYINTPQLLVGARSANVAHIPVIFGIATDDGGSFCADSKTCTTESSCLMSNLYISSAYAQDVISSGLFPLPDGPIAAAAFNTSARIETDLIFRCIDSATMYAGSTTGALKSAYYYESERGYPEDAYDPNNVNDEGTVSAAFPHGDPSTPYYKLHSSDIPSLFGTLNTLRAPSDLNAIALTSGLFASFIKSGQPNPSTQYLKVRQYSTSLAAIQSEGNWSPVSSETGPILLLDYPAKRSNFIDQPQCTFLNASIDYLLSAK